MRGRWRQTEELLRDADTTWRKKLNQLGQIKGSKNQCEDELGRLQSEIKAFSSADKDYRESLIKVKTMEMGRRAALNYSSPPTPIPHCSAAVVARNPALVHGHTSLFNNFGSINSQQ